MSLKLSHERHYMIAAFTLCAEYLESTAAALDKVGDEKSLVAAASCAGAGRVLRLKAEAIERGELLGGGQPPR